MQNCGEGKALAINNGETIAIKVGESYFDITTDGEVKGEIEVTLDTTPGIIEGQGTTNQPFVIMSIEDLVLFSKKVNEGTSYSGKYVELGKTLDFNSDLSYIDPNTMDYDTYLGGDGTKGLKEQLTKGVGFVPIGISQSAVFRGAFNGNNNSIKNIKIDVEGYAGLFGVISNELGIYNLGVEGRIKASGSNYAAGGIVGRAVGPILIEDCYVKGEIISVNRSAGGFVGGSWGAKIEIRGCKNFANISGVYQGAGGMIGGVTGSSALIVNSANLGYVSANMGSHTGGGGIVGHSNSVTIKNCYNAGIIYSPSKSSTGYCGLGGILGNIADENQMIINTLNFAEISSDYKEVTNKGGILGNIAGSSLSVDKMTFIKCYFNSKYLDRSIGRPSNQKEIATGKAETEIKSKYFVDELNKNIEDGCPYEQKDADGTTTTVTIDTTGWAKWVYNTGEYPTLDTSTIWDGSSWVTK